MTYSEWDEDMKKAFEEGQKAKSILDNPYWKSYPKPEGTHEESLARHWVQGWLKGDTNETAA